MWPSGDSVRQSNFDRIGSGGMKPKPEDRKAAKASRHEPALIANRVDAYRMFKDLTAAAGFTDFAFLTLLPLSAAASYASFFDMHSLPQLEIELLEDEANVADDDLIRHLCDHASPFSAQLSAEELLDTGIGILRHFSFRYCTAFSFPSAGAARHAIAFFAHRKGDAVLGMGDLMVESFRRYDRFYTSVLRNESLGAIDERDRAILSCTAQGMTSLAVARKLKISEHTVNSHVAALIKRFDVVNRPQLIATAIRTGLID